MVQPKQSPKEKKNTKDATQMKNMKPVFKGPNSKLPMPKNLTGKARNGKPVKKAFLGSMLGGMGKQMLGGMASQALGGLMGGGKSGGGATAQGGQGEAQTPMPRKSTDSTPVRTRGMMKKGGKVSKAKNGKSFPDLNKDGKITKADILKGRGVIAQKGAKVKKKTGMDAVKAVGKYVSTFGGATERDNPKQKDINIVKKLKETGTKVKNKLGLKSGGSVKKCKYGCK